MGVGVVVGVKVNVGGAFTLLMDISVETSSVGCLVAVLRVTELERGEGEATRGVGLPVGAMTGMGVGVGGGVIFLKKGRERLPK